MKKKILLLAMALCIGYVANGREDGKCDCGGRLTSVSKCFAETYPCFSCGGDGRITGGGLSFVCGLCNGTGVDTIWTPGYKCTSCGNKYANWGEQ